MNSEKGRLLCKMLFFGKLLLRDGREKVGASYGCKAGEGGMWCGAHHGIVILSWVDKQKEIIDAN